MVSNGLAGVRLAAWSFATAPDASSADRAYAYAADVLGLGAVALFAAANALVLAGRLPALAGPDPAWNAICDAGFAAGLGLGAAAGAWSQGFAQSAAMVVALMVPLAAPWRLLRPSAPRPSGAWAALAAYAIVWLAAEACVGLVEVGVEAFAAAVGAAPAPADLLKILLAAAAVQRIWGGLHRAPGRTAGCGATASGAGFRDGLTAGAACVRANVLAMAAMCVAGAVSRPALAFLLAAMAIDRLAPSVAGSPAGRLTFAGLAIGLSVA